jgi:heat-inducible transcriptional repressor
MDDVLTNREKEVLKFIVENFIKSAVPVGSRAVSKQSDLSLSSATIRNVMSDLEEKELIKTPHTSAGRMPTDKGYRYYVNTLMNKAELKSNEINIIKNQIQESLLSKLDDEDFLSETSRILGRITHQLAVVTQPFLSSGILEKIEVISLSSTKLLVIISIKSGYVKTLVLEIDSEIQRSKLERLTLFLNEHLSGIKLIQIRESLGDLLKNFNENEPELLQLFINSVDKIFSEEEKGGNVFIGGAGEVIMQPEFGDPKNFKNIVNLSEDKNLVLHIFQNTEENDEEVSIKIGSENLDKKLKDYSIVCSTYRFGDLKGKIGVIGPKRMNYAKIVSLMEYVSKLISEIYI